MDYDFINNCNKYLDDDNFKKLCLSNYTNISDKLKLPIGYIDNKEPLFIDFEKVSSLFIGGSTGTGKSIFIDSLIILLMLKNTFNDVRFILFNKNKVELGEYNGIKYLIENNISKDDKVMTILESLLKLIKERVDILKNNNKKNITSYNKKASNKWLHLFIFIDEGPDILKSNEARSILETIIDYGKIVGVHIIYATNDYLKDYTTFIDKFKYRMTFDLASIEQAKYINIRGSSWLKGESIIKGNNHRFKFQTPFISNNIIEKVIKEIGKG